MSSKNIIQQKKKPTKKKNNNTNKNTNNTNKNTNNKNNNTNNKNNNTNNKMNIQNIKLVNNEQIDKENIYSKLDNDISIISFTRAINNIKKLLIDTNIMLMNISLTDGLIKNYDKLTKYILNSDKSQTQKEHY